MTQYSRSGRGQTEIVRDCTDIVSLAKIGRSLSDDQVKRLMRLMTGLFRSLMVGDGHDSGHVKTITTKFRDAGRRSPPWRPTSQTVIGLPQDGADGNRRNRWEFPQDHKFYADFKTAHFVEIRYYLQALSMENAPVVPCEEFRVVWDWLVSHPVEPGAYHDPIQLVPMDLNQFVADRRCVESGHITPLDRGGRHVPDNSFLMTIQSNRMQGNLTVDELLDLMRTTLERHQA